MAEWHVCVAETLTGLIVADINPIEQPTYTRDLCDKGTWGVKLLVGYGANDRDELHSFTQSAKYSWVISYGSYIVQAGPIWTYQFADESAVLTVAGSGLSGLFDRRAVLNPDGTGPIVDASHDVTYTKLSLRGIMARLVADNMTQSGYGLPLDVPAADSGSAERHYYGYDLAMLADRMNDLSDVLNGPEYDVAPYFVPGQNKVRWRLDIGDPKLGDQDTLDVWDYDGALQAIDVDVNGSTAPVSRVWAKGTGSERDLLTGFAQDTSLVGEGNPPIDYVDSDHTSAHEQDTLDGYAQADLAAFRHPTATWSCTVSIDGTTHTGREVSPALGSWGLGDAPTFGITGHPWIPDGQYRRRILGFGHHSASRVALTLEPAAEVV